MKCWYIPPKTHNVSLSPTAVALDRDLGREMLTSHDLEFLSNFQQSELIGKLLSERPPQNIMDPLTIPMNPALRFWGRLGRDVQRVLSISAIGVSNISSETKPPATRRTSRKSICIKHG